MGRRYVLIGIALAVALLSVSTVASAPTQTDKRAALLIIPTSVKLVPGSTFTINVSVVDVTDLYAWEVVIPFDPSTLNCTNAWVPADHVFNGKRFFFFPRIDNEKGRVSCCGILGRTSLFGNEVKEFGFNGSGTLCQIEFKVLKLGKITWNFSNPYEWTFLRDSNNNLIPIQGWEMPQAPQTEDKSEEVIRKLLPSMGWENISFRGGRVEGKLYGRKVSASVDWDCLFNGILREFSLEVFPRNGESHCPKCESPYVRVKRLDVGNMTAHCKCDDCGYEWDADVEMNGTGDGIPVEEIVGLPEKSTKECLDIAKKFMACYAEVCDLSPRSKSADIREYANMIPSTFVNGQIIEKGMFALQINATETGFLLSFGYRKIGGYTLYYANPIVSAFKLSITKSGVITEFERTRPGYLGSAQVNITPEQAVEIAKPHAEKYIEKYSLDVKIVSVEIRLILVCDIDRQLGKDYAYYPVWEVRFYFDKRPEKWKGMVGCRVALWAENGEAVNLGTGGITEYESYVGTGDVENPLSPYTLPIIAAPTATAIILLGVGAYKIHRKVK